MIHLYTGTGPGLWEICGELVGGKLWRTFCDFFVTVRGFFLDGLSGAWLGSSVLGSGGLVNLALANANDEPGWFDRGVSTCTSGRGGQ